MRTTMFAASAALACSALAEPPAAPLVTHDPFISVWSMNERLTDDWPRHWSGATMGMAGLLRVDGSPFRWCGPLPADIQAARQLAVDIGPMATVYRFEAGGVELRVEFASPLGGDDINQATSGVSSVGFSAKSVDGKAHDASVYLDLTGEWCTGSPDSAVQWSRLRVDGLEVLRMGSVEQPTLRHAGDRRTIDWGYIHLAAGAENRAETAVAPHSASRGSFAEGGHLPTRDDLRMPRPANDDWPVLATAVTLGPVASDGTPTQPRHFLIGFDEVFAVEYFGRPLDPLWKRAGRGDLGDQLAARWTSLHASAAQDAAGTKLLDEARAVGGDEYARMVSLAYRQVLAGHALVADWDGTPLMFSKENTSNGCIATVDVIYPACPFFLYHNPAMLEAQLRPVLDYASSSRWRFPFAPHDLGTYPRANGQVYGGGEHSEENQMPVEESGNMLIMLAALAKVQGNVEFARPYLPILERWAEYLREHGLDPTNQLCTDDFAGHLARNANLSAKTCVALAAYAQLRGAAGDAEAATRWRAIAVDFAKRWIDLAKGSKATVLVFGEKGRETWSQKYNLVWDRALGLGLFPSDVVDREVAWYREHLGPFGLPLDSRMTYTKLDWTVWSACLTGRRADFDAIMAPVYRWLGASPPPSRVPLTDWYETTDGRTKGMHTRTVVGGLWMPLLMRKLGSGW